MPSRPPRLNLRPRAPRASFGWNKRKSRQARGYGREHDMMRALVLVEEPLCRICLEHDRTTATAIADHIKPKAEGGTDERSNYQGLCGDCHREKTAREARRGRIRARDRAD